MALVVVGGVIIAKDGIYRHDGPAAVLEGNNFKLIDQVSLKSPAGTKTQTGESVKKPKEELIALLPKTVKNNSPEEKSSEKKVPDPEILLPDRSDNQKTQPEPEKTKSPAPIVPKTPAAPEPTPTGKPAPAFPIDINTAEIKELQNITGVGPVIAQRIIDDRNANGPFYTISDIKRVNGIGDVTFEKMITQITVGNVIPPPKESENGMPNPAPAKININTAGSSELEDITGVGPVIAGRIIDYRVQNGPFQNLEDIKNVSGIGEATFKKMKDEITI